MNIIMSLWTKPCVGGKAHGYSSIECMIDSIILSANVIKRHYSEVHFYTDKQGYDWIEPYLNKLPFTKIEVCLDEINWLDDRYWSLGKMYVYSLQKEPFIHIDNDVFVWEKFNEQLLDSDFLFQEIETFNDSIWDFYNKGLKIYGLAIPKEIEVLDSAFNCGVFGCLTKEALDLIPIYYKTGFNFVKRTKIIPNIEKESMSNRWLASVIIEQVFIYSLVLANNLKFNTLLDSNTNKYKLKYTHQIGATKRNNIVENRIKERIESKNFII